MWQAPPRPRAGAPSPEASRDQVQRLVPAGRSHQLPFKRLIPRQQQSQLRAGRRCGGRATHRPRRPVRPPELEVMEDHVPGRAKGQQNDPSDGTARSVRARDTVSRPRECDPFLSFFRDSLHKHLGRHMMPGTRCDAPVQPRRHGGVHVRKARTQISSPTDDIHPH